MESMKASALSRHLSGIINETRQVRAVMDRGDWSPNSLADVLSRLRQAIHALDAFDKENKGVLDKVIDGAPRSLYFQPTYDVICAAAALISNNKHEALFDLANEINAELTDLCFQALNNRKSRP